MTNIADFYATIDEDMVSELCKSWHLTYYEALNIALKTAICNQIQNVYDAINGMEDGTVVGAIYDLKNNNK